MKARPFLAALMAAALALLSFGFGAWWLLLQRGPLSLQQQPLHVPLAARFVPRTAPLSLHWLLDPDQPSAYARAVAPPRQRLGAAATMDRLRDGAFAAAGLDYTSELAPWLGSETSLALLSGPGESGPTGWVLALRSRDSSGARRFLQRFWQTRSLAGTDLQISSYRGMGLISGRGALVGQAPQPLATALINDDLVLIASGRGVLEQALDVSQIDELNQAGSPALQQAVDRLGRGVALLTARPAALQQWLGLPASALAGQGEQPGELMELVAALQPSGRSLQVDALAQLRHRASALSGAAAEPLLRALQRPAGSLLLLTRPAALLSNGLEPAAAAAPGVAPLTRGDAISEPRSAATGPATAEATADASPETTPPLITPTIPEASPQPVASDAPSINPWRQLLGPAIERALVTAGGPLPALVAGADTGPLLWARQPEGWLLGTTATSPDLDRVNLQLAGLGYSASPLESRGLRLQAWTRLQSRPVKGDPDQLQAELAGARSLDGGNAWWGQGLSVLHQQRDGHQPPTDRLDQLEALAMPQAPFQWAMDAETARSLLASWTPWRLVNTLASTPLAPAVDGAALSLEAQPGDPQALHLRGRLQLKS
jgi:hypothetical protein